MARYLLFALLLALSCVFAGCASDPSTTGNDPYHLEQSGTRPTEKSALSTVFSWTLSGRIKNSWRPEMSPYTFTR